MLAWLSVTPLQLCNRRPERPARPHLLTLDRIALTALEALNSRPRDHDAIVSAEPRWRDDEFPRAAAAGRWRRVA